MKRYLILGAHGLVGDAVTKQLNGKHEWAGTYFKREKSGLIKLDITSSNDLENLFSKIKPTHVINCTNLSGGVDFCESHPDLAKKFHVDGNIFAGTLCEQYKARMVLISTDYVFDGKHFPYKENDKTNPLNVYGRLKLEAEHWLVNHVARYTIVRTTNVFGWDPDTDTPNYMMSLYRTIKDRKQFRAPAYLWGNPTYVDDLASAIIELCNASMNGIFHVVGSSFINRYDWAMKACKLAGWDTSLITEVTNIPDNIVPRPLKSNLDTGKFRSFGKTKLRDVEEGIHSFLKRMNA